MEDEIEIVIQDPIFINVERRANEFTGIPLGGVIIDTIPIIGFNPVTVKTDNIQSEGFPDWVEIINQMGIGIK